MHILHDGYADALTDLYDGEPNIAERCNPYDVLLHEDPNKRSDLVERRDAGIEQFEATGLQVFDSVLAPNATLFDRLKMLLPPSMRLRVKRFVRSIKPRTVHE